MQLDILKTLHKDIIAAQILYLHMLLLNMHRNVDTVFQSLIHSLSQNIHMLERQKANNTNEKREIATKIGR